MRIGRIWFPVTTLGYGKRLGIWVQGCDKHCKNCISPEFQNSNDGINYSIDKILNGILDKKQIDGLTVSGGEPFNQEEDLLELVLKFKKSVNDDILIFTGYTLEELHEKKSSVIETILDNIAVLIDGKYENEKNDGIGLRGSTNQKIHIWKYKERYADLEHVSRKLQCVLMENHLWFIGIPPNR